MSETSADERESTPEIRVERISGTAFPEELVVRAARGDYFDGYVGDVSLEELLEPVEYTDEQYQTQKDRLEAYGIHWNDVIETEAKTHALLEQLIRRGHWGPFEHPQATFAIANVSRACMAQVTRHRHASFDVQSQRYVDFSEKTPKTPKSLVDDQHFSREAGQVGLNDEGRERARELLESEMKSSFEVYEMLVDEGVPKEDARFVLPIGTPVNMTVSLNARALMHVLNLRGKGDAQWEIRALSDALRAEFEEWMWTTSLLINEHGPFTEAP